MSIIKLEKEKRELLASFASEKFDTDLSSEREEFIEQLAIEFFKKYKRVSASLFNVTNDKKSLKMAMNNQQIFELISSRRTYFKFLNKHDFPISKEDITQCLEAAITAPNHKMTQPWLFWDLGVEQQLLFAELYAKNKAENKFTTGSNAYHQLYNKSIDKFTSLPKIILVGQILADKIITQKEDYAACACAIQNFQLMAWQKNIGMQWSTGAIINDERSYQLLGINKSEIELIGALYLGNIDDSCQPNKIDRKPLQEVLTNLD